MAKIGGYNQFLHTSLPENLCAYDPSKYTLQEAQNIHLNAFPRVFALEILEVYSGPPKIAYKFRHWSAMWRIGSAHWDKHFTVDESTMKVGKVEFFYDPRTYLTCYLPRLSALGVTLDYSRTTFHSGALGCAVRLASYHLDQHHSATVSGDKFTSEAP